MEYLIGLVIIVLLLLFFDSQVENERYRIIIRFLVIFVLTYFAALRDGLGQDYEQYTLRLGYVDTTVKNLNILQEPSFWILAYIIDNSNLSTIAFFAIMSVFTLVPLLYNFFKYEGYHYSIVIFLLFAGCGYFQTFNLVRQFCAVAFVFWAFSYLLEKNLKAYYLCIFLAIIFHRSAIVLSVLPVLLRFANFRNQYVQSVVLLFSFFTRYFPVINLNFLLLGDERYDSFITENVTSSSTTVFLFLTCVLLYIIFTRRSVYADEKEEMSFNLGYICVFLYNFSVWNAAFSRLALYFAPMLMVLLGLKMNDDKGLRFVGLLFFVILFFNMLISAHGNPLIIPSRILPISSLFS